LAKKSLKSAQRRNSLNMPTHEKTCCFDKDIELQKIQIVKDAFQSYFNLGGSILVGMFVSVSVLILTLYMSRLIGIILIVVMGVIAIASLFWMDGQTKQQVFETC
jgi:hypothetical protein